MTDVRRLQMVDRVQEPVQMIAFLLNRNSVYSIVANCDQNSLMTDVCRLQMVDSVQKPGQVIAFLLNRNHCRLQFVSVQRPIMTKRVL